MCKVKDGLKEDIRELGELILNTINENKKLKEFNDIANIDIEHTDDILYVTDIETDIILFANSTAKSLFGNIIGKKCYEVLQGYKQQCPFCTNKIITEKLGKQHKWIFYNEKLGKLFYIVDVAKEVNGKILRFERATNLNGETKQIVKLAHKYNLA